MPITSFTSYKVEGFETLEINGFTSMEFNWNGSVMFSFAITTSGAPYNKDLKASSTIKLSTASPQITIAGLTETNLSSLNGSYYVTKSGLNLIWVKKDGCMAITWTP